MNYTTVQGIMSRGNGELLAHSQPNAYTPPVNEFMAQNTQQVAHAPRAATATPATLTTTATQATHAATPNAVPKHPYQPPIRIGYNPTVREEIIRGEDAIRQAIQNWRQHLITHWRNEPLRLAIAMHNPHPIYPAYTITLNNNINATLRYIDHSARVLPWGCNILSLDDKDPDLIAPKTVLGIEPNYGPDTPKLTSIILIQAHLPVLYDPITLLFALLVYKAEYSLTQPITASEIVQRAETIAKYPDKHWLQLGDCYYPVELLQIASDRL